MLILEREGAPGKGSTGRATGGVRAQFETEINIQLSLYSLDFFRDWSVDCGYEPQGYVFLATSDEHLEFLSQSVQTQVALGYRGVHLVDRQDIANMVPGLNCEDIAGGSFGPRDGFIDPPAILNGFLSNSLSNGAELRTNAAVMGIVTSGERVRGVETEDGLIECNNVVLCTGAWSRQLAATAHVDLPLEPQRRQIVWAKTQEPLPPKLPMVIDLSDGFHFRPARGLDDEVLFAYPDPQEPTSFRTDFEDSFTESVNARARHRAPFLASARVLREKCRAGLYENTPDHHAILGKCEIGGLYLANGFSGHGVMHSPATGRALAEIILDGQASFIDVSCLTIDRFRNGHLLHETAFI